MNFKTYLLKTELICAMNDILNIINQGKGDCID
jgi:hypothetical protein